MRYDAIIIGAGQAGPSLAAALAGLGEKVALVEGYKIGGACVNYGCIPTKTLIASARAAHMARRGGDFGVVTGPVTIDFEKVMSRKDERVDGARGGLEEWLQGIENIDIHRAYAHFEGTQGGLHQVRAGDALLEAERVYINTGTHHFTPPIEGVDTVPYLTNEGILNLKELPEHLVVMGGGYIGLEMAQAFRRFGSEVTVIEGGPRVAGREDEDVSDAVREILEGEGVAFLTEHRVKGVSPGEDGGVSVMLTHTGSGTDVISGSHLLVAVGRRPNSGKLNLESVGVETDARGFISVDEHLRSNIKGIFALGDVNGQGAFTHTSYQDHEVVLDNHTGGDRTRCRTIAYAMYIDPPLGRVGMSEREAIASGRPVLKAVKHMADIGRAKEQSETQGFIKLLVDAETQRFLGATVLGYHGDDVVQVISYFMATGVKVSVMKEALPIHPTVSEFFPTMLGELEAISTALY